MMNERPGSDSTQDDELVRIADALIEAYLLAKEEEDQILRLLVRQALLHVSQRIADELKFND